MSIGSTDYKYLKYMTNNASANHPSHYDRDLDSSISSFESLHAPPSKTQSATARINGRRGANTSSSNTSQKVPSFISEPILKRPTTAIMPLTEEVLAIHNSVVPPFQPFDYEEQLEVEEEEEEEKMDHVLEQSLLDRVDEKCKTMQQEFDEKLKQLEEQFTKAEKDFSQSRNDLEELDCMEKEYLSQGTQTDLNLPQLNHLQQESNKTKELAEFVQKTREIIWDTPFLPLDQICRQLPTAVNIQEDLQGDEDVCDYHRERIEKFKQKAEKKKKVYFQDNNATLDQMSNWSKAIKQQY